MTSEGSKCLEVSFRPNTMMVTSNSTVGGTMGADGLTLWLLAANWIMPTMRRFTKLNFTSAEMFWNGKGETKWEIPFKLDRSNRAWPLRQHPSAIATFFRDVYAVWQSDSRTSTYMYFAKVDLRINNVYFLGKIPRHNAQIENAYSSSFLSCYSRNNIYACFPPPFSSI